MPTILEFENISKQYCGFFRQNTHRVLDRFSLAVERGEIFGFLGPNGAGKTTAIHIAMGFVRPTSGSGTMLGSPFGTALIRRRVGFLGENVALYHRPLRKLVRFYGGLNGIGDPQLRKRTREVLEAVEMNDVAERNAGKLSRGLAQRAGLAQALVNDPELLILDEPTSALDPVARVAVRELLLSARNAGKTIFLSSHLLSEIELICDRVAILQKGRVARIGSTARLLESGDQFEIVASGIAVEQFPGAIAADHSGRVQIKVQAAQQQAMLEKIWQRGGVLINVNPVRKSLEELFLQLASEKNQTQAGDKNP